MKEKEKSKEKNPIMIKTTKNILFNLIPLFIIIIYLIGLYFTSSNLEENTFSRTLQITTMMFLTATIIIFEIAYKKDNGLLAMYGIEILFVSCHALAIPYFIIAFSWEYKWICIATAAVVIVYYIFKAVILYTMGRKELLNSLSDINEIIKKDEPRKKEAVKKKKSK